MKSKVTLRLPSGKRFGSDEHGSRKLPSGYHTPEMGSVAGANSNKKEKTYTVFFSGKSQKELSEIPTPYRENIESAILSLEVNPRPIGVEKLKEDKKTLRIRVGNYRVLYLVDEEKNEVAITKVAHRKEVYGRRGTIGELVGTREFDKVATVGVKIPMFRDPTVTGEKLKKLLASDKRALSNPNMPIDTLISYASEYPVEVELNPVTAMISMEDPAKGRELLFSLAHGFRFKMMTKLPYRDRVNVIADCVALAEPDAVNRNLRKGLRDLLRYLRVHATKNHDNDVDYGEPFKLTSYVSDEEFKSLSPRDKALYTMARHASSQPIETIMAMHSAVLTDGVEYRGLWSNPPENLQRILDQADIVRKHYYAASPTPPADIKRQKKTKISGVAPFGFSEQTRNPSPDQLAALQVLAPKFAQQFSGLWQVFTLENPGLPVEARIHKRDDPMKWAVERYAIAFRLIDSPSEQLLSPEEMRMFIADCIEWFNRNEDDSKLKHVFRYLACTLRGVPKYNWNNALRYSQDMKNEIATWQWSTSSTDELKQAQCVIEIIHWATGLKRLDQLHVFERLASTNTDVVAELADGASPEAAHLEAYQSFAALLERRLFDQGETIAGKKYPSVPDLKKFLKLPQEAQTKIAHDHTAWIVGGLHGKRVSVHLNLGKSWSSGGIGTWSVKYGANKKLVGHVFGVKLKNVTFDVSPTGSMQAIVARDKIVHAYITGELVEAHLIPGWEPDIDGATPIRYSPDRSGTMFFVREKNGSWSTPVSGAKEAIAIGGIGERISTGYSWPWKPIYAKHVEDMSDEDYQKGLNERREAFLSHHSEWEHFRSRRDEADLLKKGGAIADGRKELELARKQRYKTFSKLGL